MKFETLQIYTYTGILILRIILFWQEETNVLISSKVIFRKICPLLKYRMAQRKRMNNLQGIYYYCENCSDTYILFSEGKHFADIFPSTAIPNLGKNTKILNCVVLLAHPLKILKRGTNKGTNNKTHFVNIATNYVNKN